jgi:tRNA A37 threonylcarbamoyladenosine synthetase subunit TsaC/SUA5/YrdC
MSQNVNVISLSEDGYIERAQVYRIRKHLESGGLCILPSDTSYALVGLPFIRGVTADINSLLDKGMQQVPLTFGTQPMAERFVIFDRAHLQLIDTFTPGPITIVATIRKDLPPPMKREAIAKVLNTVDTVGVRFPRSIVENQLSSELERPLTTSAILYRDHSPVKNFVDALDIVEEAVEQNSVERAIIGIRRRSNIRQGNLSTVVIPVPASENPDRFILAREGELPEDKIRSALKALDRYVARDYEDWT